MVVLMAGCLLAAAMLLLVVVMTGFLAASIYQVHCLSEKATIVSAAVETDSC
jgi:uncharacterized membrane protein